MGRSSVAIASDSLAPISSDNTVSRILRDAGYFFAQSISSGIEEGKIKSSIFFSQIKCRERRDEGGNIPDSVV